MVLVDGAAPLSEGAIMSTYSLEFHVFDAKGERTGETVCLATVSNGTIQGKMRHIVEDVLALGVVPIGITGPIVAVTHDDADLVAYSLAHRSAALWDAGVTDDGIVVAVDANGSEIPFRFANNPPLPDLISLHNPEDGEVSPGDLPHISN